MQLKILLVEDDSQTVSAVMRTFHNECEVLIAQNVQQAVNLVRSKSVDLVLLDLGLPNENAFSFFKHFKSCPALSSIPVIVLTSSQNPEDEIKSFNLGADDFVKKPFHLDCLKARVLTRMKAIE